MLQNLYPKERYKSAYEVDYDALYEKGFRGIIFDIDNTLVNHGAPANEKALFLVRRLKKIGFQVFCVSNNKEPRVKAFCDAIGAGYVFKAGKPKGSGYQKAIEKMGLPSSQVLSVGDQIFTDMWGANRAGIYSVLVGQLDKKEEPQIVLKRKLEYFVLLGYQNHLKKTEDKKHE